MCVDGAFKALADTSRRRLLHSLNARNGQSLRARALADLKTVLEQHPMATTQFVYTISIETNPERLWRALTDPTFTGEC